MRTIWDDICDDLDLDPEVEHGSYSTYSNLGCHCELCREANAAYQADKYQRTGSPKRAVKKRQREYRAWIQSIKLESGCVDCGYNEHAEALDFDHLPGFEKAFNLGSQGFRYSRALVLAEIAKCEVVCSNCHRVRTAERRAA